MVGRTNWSSTKEEAFVACTEKSNDETVEYSSRGLCTTCKTSSRYRRLSSGSKLVIWVLTAALAIHVLLWLWITHPVAHFETGDHSVYVSGGGFSGFWFILGRLHRIQDLLEKDFYCFSAGCLAVVATLRNFSMEEVYAFASDAQVRWQQGTLHRHDVVSAFLDDLLSTGNETMTAPSGIDWLEDSHLLSKLNVITTVKYGRFGLTADIRRPKHLRELRTMLLQTTWIPYIVGDDLWHLDHMDGALSVLYHPKCAEQVGLVANFDLLSNVANVNLGGDKAKTLWELGLNYGL